MAFWPPQSLFEPACSPRKSCPLWPAVFVPSTTRDAPTTVANIAHPTKATGRSRLEIETVQVVTSDFLSRRRCDGKLMSEISFTYSVKLFSIPLHVLVCLSWACVIRAPHCVDTCDSQVSHSYRQLMPSKIRFPNGESLHASMKSSPYTKHSSESPQARFHERLILWLQYSKICGNLVIPSSRSIDQVVYGFQQANTLMLQLQLSRHLVNWCVERVGNWLR